MFKSMSLAFLRYVFTAVKVLTRNTHVIGRQSSMDDGVYKVLILVHSGDELPPAGVKTLTRLGK